MKTEDLLSEMRSDSLQLLEEVESDLLALEQNPHDSDVIDQVFRAVHTIKGNSGFFDLTEIVAVAHESEAIMDQVRSGVFEMSQEATDLLLEAVDTLKRLLNKEISTADDDLKKRLKNFLPIQQATKQVLTKSSHMDEHTLTLDVDLTFLSKHGEFTEGVAAGLGRIGHLISSEPIPLGELDSGLGETTITLCTILPANIVADLCGLDHDAVRLQRRRGNQASKQQSAPIAGATQVTNKPSHLYAPQSEQQQAPSPQAQVEAASKPEAKAPAATSAKPTATSPKADKSNSGSTARSEGASTVKVDAQFLDDLLTFTGNMVMARNQLLTAFSEFQDDLAFATLSRCITDVHRSVVQQRMQPIGALFERFRRVVRDISRKLGKKVDLHIEGGDIELDRSILEAFADPHSPGEKCGGSRYRNAGCAHRSGQTASWLRNLSST